MLGEWSPVDGETPGMDFAERLSLWLNAWDAIHLQAALQGVKAIQAAAAGQPAGAGALHDDLQRVRTALVAAIAQDPLALADDRPPPLPRRRAARSETEPAEPVPPGDVGYGPFQQRHQELQRQMELMIGPLRDHVRQALARTSARLRQLAALDAVFEQMLAAREQALLPAATPLLQRRFDQLRLAHRQACQAAGLPDDPELWRQPGGWLETFNKDWRQALLGELDLRLEPVAGMIAAVGHEPHMQP